MKFISILALILMLTGEFATAVACNLSDVGPGSTGVVFQHKHWFVKRYIVGKEWVGIDCVGFVTHTKISVCSANQQHEICIDEDQGRVTISGANQLIINNKIYDANKLSYNINSNIKTPEWIKLLATSRKPINAKIDENFITFSPYGSSAALRFAELIK